MKELIIENLNILGKGEMTTLETFILIILDFLQILLIL